MAKFSVVIDGPVYTASDRSFVKHDYDTNEPVVDKDGLNTYQARVMTVTDGRVETLEVNVKGKEDPLAGTDPLTPVILVEPTVSVGVFQGKKYYTLSAKAIEPTGAKKA